MLLEKVPGSIGRVGAGIVLLSDFPLRKELFSIADNATVAELLPIAVVPVGDGL